MIQLASLALFAFASPSAPMPPSLAYQDEGAPPAREVALEHLRLTVTMPPFTARRDTTVGDGSRQWRGELHGVDATVYLYTYPLEQIGTDEPDQVIHRIMRSDADRRISRRYGPMQLLEGAYGRTTYAAHVVSEVLDETEVVAEAWLLAGIAETHGYLFVVEVKGRPEAEMRASLEEFVRKGVRYSGPTRDANWTEAEAKERWKQIAPDNIADKLDRVLRTENYIVLTNSAGARLFAQAMEEYFKAIRKMYPFPDVKGRKLMPVYLFRLDTEYYDFLVKNAGWTVAQARQTKGVASGEWYATWYESPKDSVHIHEATHQIFANRLLLTGGGSWFQEGVAEFMEKSHFKALNTVENFGRAVARRGEGVPLRQFFGMQSLVFSSEQDRKSGGSAAGDAYTQAASLIAFVKNDKRTRDKFLEFVHAMGAVRRGDVPAMEAVLERLFGVDIDGFEKMWKEHYR